MKGCTDIIHGGACREAGYWLRDKPEHYSKGNFMTYDNDVRAFISRTERHYRNGTMANFHKHFLGAAYQLAALQHALAIARCEVGFL